MTASDIVARFETVTRRYRSRDGGFGLAPTSLTITAGTWTSLVGRSGAGKTTLLQLLVGLDRPDAGRVWLFGLDLAQEPEGVLAALRRRRLGFVYQQFHLIRHLPVWQNVTSRLVPEGIPAAERRRRAARELAALDLETAVDRLPRHLSGGEQQRVAIARALVSAPDLLVADEPTSNVDADTGARIAERFAALRAGGTTLVVTTHDPALLEPADRVCRMEAGRIVA